MGTVGNTGNARHTPAHLHFGIYTNSGAVDPLAFVQAVKETPAIADKKVNEWYQSGGKIKLYPSPKKSSAATIAKDKRIKTLSATHQFYRVVLSDGSRGFIAMNELSDKLKL
jgi:murein DD-endopeptidase MepM/ murein hydrolase activator NlpD